MFPLLLMLHYIGDFLCQSDWMALNKSKCPKALLIHVAVYAGVILKGLLCLSFFGLIDMSLWNVVCFTAFTAALHWGVDCITSQCSSWLWQQNMRHWFFCMIGFDQLVHALCLYYTLGFFQ